MICMNCGAIFDDHDVIYVKEDYGEVHPACPVCGVDDLAESDTCELCGTEMDVEDLHRGFCYDCLWNEIDYDVALKYMLQEDDGLGLVNFFLDEWFGADCINKTTKELTAFFETLYGKLATQERDNAKLVPKIATPFLEACKNHILPGYPNKFDAFASDFADWFEEYRAKQIFKHLIGRGGDLG